MNRSTLDRKIRRLNIGRCADPDTAYKLVEWIASKPLYALYMTNSRYSHLPETMTRLIRDLGATTYDDACNRYMYYRFGEHGDLKDSNDVWIDIIAPLAASFVAMDGAKKANTKESRFAEFLELSGYRDDRRMYWKQKWQYLPLMDLINLSVADYRDAVQRISGMDHLLETVLPEYYNRETLFSLWDVASDMPNEEILKDFYLKIFIAPLAACYAKKLPERYVEQEVKLPLDYYALKNMADLISTGEKGLSPVADG